MASVPQLSTLQKSAAERPQLEVAQQQMQTRVSSLESQFEAASAGAKQVQADLDESLTQVRAANPAARSALLPGSPQADDERAAAVDAAKERR